MIVQNSQGMSAVAQRKLSEWQTSYDYNDHAWLLGRSQKDGSTMSIFSPHTCACTLSRSASFHQQEQGSEDMNQTDRESHSHPESHPIP